MQEHSLWVDIVDVTIAVLALIHVRSHRAIYWKALLVHKALEETNENYSAYYEYWDMFVLIYTYYFSIFKIGNAFDFHVCCETKPPCW